MIQFNELRINPEGTKLIIDVSVKDEPYYDNVYIDSIVIDTQDTYVTSGPSNKPVFTFTNDSEGITKVYTTCDCSSKHVKLILNHQDLNLSLKSNMFFVYAIATGVPAADTPCGMDNSVVLKTTIDLYPFYINMMNYFKELENNCNVPKNMIDYMLRFKAFELSVKTGNYTHAIKYWKRWFTNIKNRPIITKSCCNG